ncbi:MAG: hypothetical protein R3230_00840 [Nitrosopumilaceae archaeon]|nr:hypothetical protein [Nitrosopumilaceae archaeon]
MTISNKANVITRADKTEPLTYNEMNNNLEELKNVIDDAGANETAIAGINSTLTTVQNDIDAIEAAQPNYMEKTANLSDLDNLSLARSNLGVYSTTESDNRYLNEASNLSDLDDAPTSRTNLGLGDIVTRDLFISTSDPNNSNGSDGDIWLTYE